jgi:TonB family protein
MNMFVYAIIGAAAMASVTQSDKAQPVTPPPSPIIYAPPAPPPAMPASYNLPKPREGKKSDPMPASYPGLWVTTDDYPLAALREERAGTTGVELSIDTEGKVTKCFVTLSSGSPDLDDTTCALLTLRARFYPAQDKKGNKIAGLHRKSVRWVIPDYDPADAANEAAYLAEEYESAADDANQFESYPSSAFANNWDWTTPKKVDFPNGAWNEKRTGRSVLWLDIDEAGKVTKCTVKQSSSHNDLDQRACTIVQQRAQYSPAKNFEGKPTPARNVASVSWRIRDEKITDAQPYGRRPLMNNPFLKSINSQVSFTIMADGGVTDCVANEIGEQKIEGKIGICGGFRNAAPLFQPFIDINGKPEKRRVKVQINVETEKVAN